MNNPSSRISDLAARAEQGDERARRQLLHALAPVLERLAKAAVQPGTPMTPLMQRVRAIGARLDGDAGAACDPVVLARSLGRLIAARIYPRATESVAPTLLSA